MCGGLSYRNMHMHKIEMLVMIRPMTQIGLIFFKYNGRHAIWYNAFFSSFLFIVLARCLTVRPWAHVSTCVPYVPN
jgi:hypothetical protein